MGMVGCHATAHTDSCKLMKIDIHLYHIKLNKKVSWSDQGLDTSGIKGCLKNVLFFFHTV